MSKDGRFRVAPQCTCSGDGPQIPAAGDCRNSTGVGLPSPEQEIGWQVQAEFLNLPVARSDLTTRSRLQWHHRTDPAEHRHRNGTPLRAFGMNFTRQRPPTGMRSGRPARKKLPFLYSRIVGQAAVRGVGPPFRQVGPAILHFPRRQPIPVLVRPVARAATGEGQDVPDGAERIPGPNGAEFLRSTRSPDPLWTTTPGMLPSPPSADCSRMQAPPPWEARRKRQPRGPANFP